MVPFNLVDYVLDPELVGVERVYKQLFLVPAESNPSLKKLKDAIRSRFAALNPPQKVVASLKGDSLTVTIDEFRFFIGFSCAPHVLLESREIAERFAVQHPARDAIAAVACRFELNSGNDPNMDHFNDMVFICQAVESLGPVYIFNPRAKEFV
jgi:hypothetical protein